MWAVGLHCAGVSEPCSASTLLRADDTVPACVLQVRGPPAKAAFDASGAPTKALEGFCRKNGVSADAVVREADAKGVEYCWVEVKDAGKPAAQVMAPVDSAEPWLTLY